MLDGVPYVVPQDGNVKRKDFYRADIFLKHFQGFISYYRPCNGSNDESHTGSYGDFYDQNYYWSRTRGVEPLNAEGVARINRTEEVRQATGIDDAVSVASGSFAEAMKEW